jgi:sec-independent protein translocase protein TatB
VFGLTFDKLLIIGVIALLLIGPDRLPGYAKRLGDWVRRGRGYVDSARDRMREEMGPDFDDVDWSKLDPRQYDPRRIIRDALTEPRDTPAPVKPQSAHMRPTAAAQRLRDLDGAAPFDPDAT